MLSDYPISITDIFISSQTEKLEEHSVGQQEGSQTGEGRAYNGEKRRDRANQLGQQWALHPAAK